MLSNANLRICTYVLIRRLKSYCVRDHMDHMDSTVRTVLYLSWSPPLGGLQERKQSLILNLRSRQKRLKIKT